MRPLARALRFLYPYWATGTLAFLSMVLVSVANLASPQLIRRVIDDGIAVGDLGAVMLGAAGLLGVAIVRGLFSFTQHYLSEKASQSAAYDMRNTIYAKLQTLSASFHDRAQTGQLMTRVTSDVEMVRHFTGQGLLHLLGALAMMLGTVVVLVFMNWRLATVALLTLPAMLLVFAHFIRRMPGIFLEAQARLGALNTVLQENLAGVRVVKSFVREEHEASRYGVANRALLEQNLKAVAAFALAFPIPFFIINVGTVAVIWYGGLQVIGQTLTLGELVAFNTYLAFLLFPAFMLGMVVANAARAGASARRIFEVLDTQSEVVDSPEAYPLPAIRGRVAFEGVSFRYPGSDHRVLEEVSFTAEPGQTVAIVGTTGSGKSTIINLITRFYDVSEGRVTIDGHDVRSVTLASLRGQIGVVLQETVLFSGTIRENIAYGRPDASFDEVVRVARLAQAHDFILEQPEGYLTRVGEGGVGLSGGQRQRIAIARALLLDPKVLILDDSTSSVDAETEYRIQSALEGLMGSRTSFVIAQRISTVRNADLILVLDDSRIVDSGTHDELVDRCETYCEIVASQLQEDVVPAEDGSVDGNRELRGG